jgi:hypothetical protein
VLGLSVLTLGVVFLFLPAPGSLVIPLGLAILGTEFLWARSLSVWIGEAFRRLRRWRSPNRSPASPPNGETVGGSSAKTAVDDVTPGRDVACVVCSEALDGKRNPVFRMTHGDGLCLECAIRRGGVYDAPLETWSRPPELAGLG